MPMNSVCKPHRTAILDYFLRRTTRLDSLSEEHFAHCEACISEVADRVRDAALQSMATAPELSADKTSHQPAELRAAWDKGRRKLEERFGEAVLGERRATPKAS